MTLRKQPVYCVSRQQTCEQPQQRGRGAEGSEGTTSALPSLRQWKRTGRAGEGIRVAPARVWINRGFTALGLPRQEPLLTKGLAGGKKSKSKTGICYVPAK